MSAMIPFLVGVSLVVQGAGAHRPPDPATLGEMLQDRQHGRNQSQAALLLVQSRSARSVAIVRQGLRQLESPDVFAALASALRLRRDGRFTDELFAALVGGKPPVRQEAADTLALLADADVILRLHALADDPRADLDVRQTALVTLGLTGRKAAALVLLDHLSGEHELLCRTAAEALTNLTGQPFDRDVDLWRAWWKGHKDLDSETWLEERLLYQSSRARRLEGELDRSRAQVVRLHQQLFSRLPPADRLGHVQTLVDYEDPNVRALAVGWSVELLPNADVVGQRVLTELLLRLSRDSAEDVQRQAVLALGRVTDARALERLQVLLRRGRPPIRAVAARALAQQAKISRPQSPEDAKLLQRQVVASLQKALDDPALEVVVEAAEDLGSLGWPEAVPVLTALLRHPSEPVRQTAAQALERVADVSVLAELMTALDDSAVTVRFSLVGAIGHAVGDGKALAEPVRSRLLERLEDLLLRDTDPGVRSRAATVMGECGPPSILPMLGRRVLSAEDNRVQEKAWGAVMTIIARSGSVELLHEWSQKLADAKQGGRRLQLLCAVIEAWKKNDDTRARAAAVTEELVQAQLEEGKWMAAFPVVRDLLKQPGTDADVARRLGWLLAVGEQALKDGNRAEALRVVQEAQAFLSRGQALADDFERLAKEAQRDR